MKNEIKTELKEYTKPELNVLDVAATANLGGKGNAAAGENGWFDQYEDGTS